MKILIDKQTFEPLRIFCIAKNYGAHVKELAGIIPDEPVVFMKPVTSLVPPAEHVHLPQYGIELHHEIEVVLLIGQGGRNIAEAEALSHIAGVSIGLDLTLRDVQGRLKKLGHPWELSKAFEQSAPIGTFQPYDPAVINLDNLPFECSVNGDLRQEGNTQDMIFPVQKLVRALSKWWTLQTGDLIYTGTPSGVGPLRSDDRVEITSTPIGSFYWLMSPPL